MYITNEKVEGVITKEYKWNGNKLIEIKDVENNKKYKYKYNINKQREIKEIYNIISNTDVLVEKVWYYYNANGMLVREIRYEYNGNTVIDSKDISYLYDQNLELYGFILDGVSYYYKKDILGNIERIYDAEGVEVALYKSSAYGVNNVYYPNGFITVSKSFIGCINPIRFKGYYYDVETGLAMVGQRYYSPELCRFIQPADVSSLNPSSINGLNLYSYANNNPIGIAYSSSGVSGTTGSGMVNSIGKTHNLTGNNISESASRISLPIFSWLFDNATTMHGTASSLISGVPILAHYFKYASIINDEFKLYGISKWKTSLQLSNVNFKMGALDGALIGVNVLIDMYDSYQRGVSTEGILLGGTLTAASSIGMLYLNKGIMWSTTAIGTAICPGLGTAIGFTVGLGISLFVDWKLGELISDWIDSITS